MAKEKYICLIIDGIFIKCTYPPVTNTSVYNTQVCHMWWVGIYTHLWLRLWALASGCLVLKPSSPLCDCDVDCFTSFISVFSSVKWKHWSSFFTRLVCGWVGADRAAEKAMIKQLVPSFRGSSQPRGRTQVSHIAGRFFTDWAKKCIALGNSLVIQCLGLWASTVGAMGSFLVRKL